MSAKDQLSDEDQISNEVDRIISSSMNVDESEFDEETTFGAEGLDADSLSVVEMAEVVDMELGVKIPDDELTDLETVGDVKEYVISGSE